MTVYSSFSMFHVERTNFNSMNVLVGNINDAWLLCAREYVLDVFSLFAELHQAIMVVKFVVYQPYGFKRICIGAP